MEIEKELKDIHETTTLIEENIIFTEDEDKLNAYMEIHSGTGGIDAQDCSEILLKMYTTWFEKKNFDYKIIDISLGDKIGIKSASIKIEGNYAYGWTKNESGIHRLVRKSPFNSNKKRHTSFSSIIIYPVHKNKTNFEINDKELKIETYRSSGAGGQHVNKTDSAVRITHIPTKISVQSQSERSQHKNKINAIEQLKMKIYAFNKLNNIKNTNNKSEMSWGNQIRSYVFDKSYVKDIRINKEINDINFIINGNLDSFILSILKNSNKL